MVVNGSSTGNVQSLLSLFGSATGNTLNASITGGFVAGEITYSQIWSLVGLLDPAYAPNAAFALHNTYRMQVMNIVDNYNRPIFLVGGAGNASVQNGGFDSILGYSVHVVQQMVPTSTAAAVGQIPVIFGDFATAYTARSVRDSLSIVRLNELYLAQGEIGFTLFARVGGYVAGVANNPLVALRVVA
jgi:HK97 family phage major capsid protein